MIIVGLTGSIAMGKTETAKIFAAHGIPVFDSDAAVHQLYAKNGAAVKEIGTLVPDAIVEGQVERAILAGHVQRDPSLLKKVEAVVHPLVRSAQTTFLAKAVEDGAPLAVLDIPLLFETGRENEVDAIVVVSAGERLQRERALQRPGMTAEKLAFILSRQLPDEEKKARADYVIDTSVSIEATARDVERVIAELRKQAGEGA